jgi:hypothetical protein
MARTSSLEKLESPFIPVLDAKEAILKPAIALLDIRGIRCILLDRPGHSRVGSGRAAERQRFSRAAERQRGSRKAL